MRARVGGEIFVLARDRVEHVLGEDAEVLAHFPGEALAGTSYEPPFDYITDYGPRGHTVLLADFVTTDEGTGLVHTAIAFGEDDFRLGEQYGIKLQNPVDDRGRFDERITDFAGRFVKEADQDIVKALEEKGRLLRAETYLHAYPHCWRCDTPLIYYAKASWYVKTTEVRDRLLAANEEIGWHPEHIKHGRFGKWLEGNVDWALSRDRYWGTPLPIWECDAADCDERFCAGSIADLRERAGEVPDDLHRPYIDEVSWACEREGCDGTMRRVLSVDRRLVRLGLDALGPVPLPVREPGARSRSASRPTSSARRSTRPAAGSTRCSPRRCCSSAPRATATSSASG